MFVWTKNSCNFIHFANVIDNVRGRLFVHNIGVNFREVTVIRVFTVAHLLFRLASVWRVSWWSCWIVRCSTEGKWFFTTWNKRTMRENNTRSGQCQTQGCCWYLPLLKGPLSCSALNLHLCCSRKCWYPSYGRFLVWASISSGNFSFILFMIFWMSNFEPFSSPPWGKLSTDVQIGAWLHAPNLYQ